MLDRLPELIEPVQLADRNANIVGKLPLSRLGRLAELLTATEGSIDVNLLFSRKGKRVILEGHLATVLSVQCQRCLETIVWPIKCNLKLAVINSLAQTDNLPDGYEPLLLLDDEKILLSHIVEDELLINLPDAPKHEVVCAPMVAAQSEQETLIKLTPAKSESPFSILADLKNLNKMEHTNGSSKK